jgi:LysM domain.
LFSNRPTVSPTEEVAEEKPVVQKHSRHSKKARIASHKIKSGQTLSDIADKYGVTVKQLRKWNGLKGNNIRAGKKLKIRK